MQRIFFVCDAIVAILFGVGFLAVPGAILIRLGAATNDAGLLAGRHFGATLIGFAIVLLASRDLQPSSARTGILWAGAVISLIYLALALLATVTGVVNTSGWALVALNAVLGAGFVYLIANKPKLTDDLQARIKSA